MDEQSPCKNICKYVTVSEKKVCQGCGRTPEEITEWTLSSLRRKARIKKEAEKRLIGIDKHN